jgi:FkbM family methyltransferase
MNSGPHSPTYPFTWAERLKYGCLPSRLYRWQLLRRHLRHGERELRLLPELVPRARMAIDVGAHKGVYTHLLSRLCTAVHAFEPNPKMFHVLTRLPALPRNVTAHRVALSDRNGAADLIIPRDSKGYSTHRGSLHPRKKEEEHCLVPVETRTLDSFDFRNVGFVKIDVEGFEAAVLRGAEQTLRRERPTLLIELEERHSGESIETSLARVRSLGFDGFFVDNGLLQPLTDFDPDARHRQALGRGNYVFNFVFRPSDEQVRSRAQHTASTGPGPG